MAQTLSQHYISQVSRGHAPSPFTPSVFPPTPLGREEVARWLMSLGSSVPLRNMKP